MQESVGSVFMEKSDGSAGFSLVVVSVSVQLKRAQYYSLPTELSLHGLYGPRRFSVS